MKKTKLLLLLATPLLSVTVLTGCNKNKTDKDTLTIAVADTKERKTLEVFIDGFKKLPGNENIKFKKVVMGKGYKSYIEDSFRDEDLADIVSVYDYDCEYYTNADLDGLGTSLLQPISEFMKRDGIKETDFYESVIEMTKCKTGSQDMYWVPRDYNKVVCAYNKKMFDAAGLNYPTNNWTWSEFVSTLEALKAKEEVIKAEYWNAGTFFPVDMNLNFMAVHYPMLKTYGIDLIDKTNGTCFGNKMEEAKTAWGKFISIVDAGLAPTPDESVIPFTSKQAAMMFIVRPNLPTYVDNLGGDAIDFVTLPKYDDISAAGKTSYVGMGCTGYGITTSCPDNKKELAWKFLSYVISEEGQNAFSEAGSGIPSLKKLATDENAAFKKYISKDMNHAAFIAEPERDVPMNFLKGFQVEKQREIYDFIKNRTLKDFCEASDRDAYYQQYKTEMEKIWKK